MIGRLAHFLVEYGMWNMEYGIWKFLIGWVLEYGFGIWNMVLEYGIWIWNMEYDISYSQTIFHIPKPYLCCI